MQSQDTSRRSKNFPTKYSCSNHLSPSPLPQWPSHLSQYHLSLSHSQSQLLRSWINLNAQETLRRSRSWKRLWATRHSLPICSSKAPEMAGTLDTFIPNAMAKVRPSRSLRWLMALALVVSPVLSGHLHQKNTEFTWKTRVLCSLTWPHALASP